MKSGIKVKSTCLFLLFTTTRQTEREREKKKKTRNLLKGHGRKIVMFAMVVGIQGKEIVPTTGIRRLGRHAFDLALRILEHRRRMVTHKHRRGGMRGNRPDCFTEI